MLLFFCLFLIVDTNVNLVRNLCFCHVKAPLWEWAVVPMQPVDLALKLLLAGCHPVGVGDTLVAGGRQFLADNRSTLSAGGHGFGPAPGMSDCLELIRDHDKWGFFLLCFFFSWSQQDVGTREKCRSVCGCDWTNVLEFSWCQDGSAEPDGCDETVRATVSTVLSAFRHLSGHRFLELCV